MSDFEYLRPESIEQALQWLGRARPMGGGTELTPRRDQLPAVLDLQDLGLDGHERRGDRLALGAGMRLQTMLEGLPGLPAALQHACRLEAGWNMRNQATLAGSVVSGDGRSPLLVCLLALGTALELEPGAEQIALEQYLQGRSSAHRERLITWVGLDIDIELRYASVARSPADRPVVCAAVARLRQAGWRVALGGHGPAPIRAPAAEAALSQGSRADWRASTKAAGEAAAQAYARMDDAWASAAYRSAVAGTLVRRLAEEIGPQ